MVKQAVKVLIRSRPTANFASKNIQINQDKGKVTVTIPKSAEQGVVNNQLDTWDFKFDKILHNASQEDVYMICAKEITSSVVEGYNGTVMCYGQTGAGKTFTISGSSQNYKYRGIIPRSLNQIFQEISSKFEQSVTVRVSYVEIYNELMFDLLSTVPTHEQSGAIMIQDDPRGGIHVKGLSMHIVNNEEDALNLLFQGETNRTISGHQLNLVSSRSHCVFTVHIESRSRVESSEKVISSKLNLVDLAGSERTKKTGSEGLTLKEAAYINKSLSFLEQVVVALCDRKRDHVPYRQSRLTHLLKDSIGGNCKTLMVANVWPEPQHLEETISTLKFATRMMHVANEASINIHADPQLLIKKYEGEIRNLKQELAMHDTLANRGRINYDPYSPEQQYQIQKVAEKFLAGDIEDIEEIESLRQVRELFYQFRTIYQRTLQEMPGGGMPGGRVGSSIKDGSGTGIDADATRKAAAGEGVGETDERKGFGLGIAPRDARPTIPIDVSRSKDRDEQEHEEGDQDEQEEDKSQMTGGAGGEERKHVKSSKKKKREPMDRQKAFIEYKETDGKQLESAIRSDMHDLKEKKNQAKILTESCNKSRKEMERIKERLDEKRMARKADLQNELEEVVIDEEEYSYYKELKELKSCYREDMDKLRNVKADINALRANLDQLKQQLVLTFESWYEDKFGVSPGEESTWSPEATTKQSIIEKERVKEEGDDLANEIDQDALAYIRAKKHVATLQRARKIEKMKYGG